MAGRFSSFTFVERITQLEAGRRARGIFQIPVSVESFPHGLAAEASGQLAAWVAMARLDFRSRPVAGLAAGVKFGADPRPGRPLDLEVAIDSCDAHAVSYSAWARQDGAMIVEVQQSVGPMLPMEEFDSPDAVREHFGRLCEAGVVCGEFMGVAPHDLEVIERVPGEHIRAVLRVPLEAPFFVDHFPRKPVYPGTLLLDAQIELALQAAVSPHWPRGTSFAAVCMPDLKVRAFTFPGEILELTVELAPPENGSVRARTAARASGKLVAGGSLEMVPRQNR